MSPTGASQTSKIDEVRVSASQLAKRKLRHGFKAEAKRLANDIRRQSGHDLHAPLALDKVARYLRVKVVELLSDLGNRLDAHHIVQLTEIDSSVFSAVTIPLPDTRHLVVVNDSHDEFRQRSSTAHELGHIVLGHESPPPFTDLGCREVHADVESEASFFG